MSTTVSIAVDEPVFTLEKNEYARAYTICFAQAGTSISIQLSQPSFDALVQQGQALLPLHEIALPDLDAENIWRKTAWILKKLDDKSLQTWLREIQSDSLITVLWYLKDRDFAKSVFRNMSERSAESLLEDLFTKYYARGESSEKDPRMLEAGRAELKEVLSILYRLASEGYLEMEIPE